MSWNAVKAALVLCQVLLPGDHLAVTSHHRHCVQASAVHRMSCSADGERGTSELHLKYWMMDDHWSGVETRRLKVRRSRVSMTWYPGTDVTAIRLFASTESLIKH